MENYCKKLQLIVFLVICSLCSGFAEKITYNGYKLLTVYPEHECQTEHLLALQEQGVNFPSLVRRPGQPSNLLLSPQEFTSIVEILDKHDIYYKVQIEDVGKVLASEKVCAHAHEGRLNWDEYYTLDAIIEYLEEQVSANPTLAAISSIGQSYEGRNITLFTISKDTGTPGKPIIYFESTIHAREWITGAVTTYVIDQLLNGNDADLLAYLDTFDFYFIPVANPDGYVYSHRTDRFWRKTRSHTPSPVGCMGVDPNRNWDQFWMENGGASGDPCSNGYAGTAPFSEPEVLAMANFMRSPELQSRMAMYLSLHSAGQYLLIPWGLNSSLVEHHDAYMQIANRAAEAHTNEHGMNYTAGSITQLMYIATGTSLDWAYFQVPTAKFHVTYELRDKGEYGHLLPPDQILPNAQEFVAGFKTLLEDVSRKLAE